MPQRGSPVVARECDGKRDVRCFDSLVITKFQYRRPCCALQPPSVCRPGRDEKGSAAACTLYCTDCCPDGDGDVPSLGSRCSLGGMAPGRPQALTGQPGGVRTREKLLFFGFLEAQRR